MARIDSILSILVQQGATELRLGTDRLPKMFQRGVQKRLAIPETSDETLRHLLGPLLNEERETELKDHGRIDFAYEAPTHGIFQVLMTTRASEPGFDVVFMRAAGRGELH